MGVEFRGGDLRSTARYRSMSARTCRGKTVPGEFEKVADVVRRWPDQIGVSRCELATTS